jgi:AraC-like DNA-binding protein
MERAMTAPTLAPTLAQDGMRYWRLRPDARLQPWVQCYWMVEPAPAAVSGTPQLPDLLIPDGHSELVFRLSGAFTRWQLGEPARDCMDRSYVIGGRSKSVLTISPGGLRLAGVKLEPRALRSLLRIPLSGLRDNTVGVADLGCRPLLDLEDQIANLQGVGQLGGLLDRFFLRSLGEDVDDDASVHGLIESIRAAHGAQPILRWAREHRIDTRTLERRFVARMGMTPKQFARVERFKHSYLHLNGGQARTPRRPYLEGYYDESHFDREYRHFTGTSPFSRRRDAAGFNTTIGDHLLEGEMG